MMQGEVIQPSVAQMAYQGASWTVEGPCVLQGTVDLEGAKNGVLVAMSALLLTRGISTLRRVPPSSDVAQMCELLSAVGARVVYDANARLLLVDTSTVHADIFSPEFLSGMRSMRAASLLLGPLLARYGRARVAWAKGCDLGTRPLDFHVRIFMKMGAQAVVEGDWLELSAERLHPIACVLEYPSVGATENAMLAAALIEGVTTIENAAIEPEVMDLADILRKMGARVEFRAPALVRIEGVRELRPIVHDVLVDRLEAGTYLMGAAITGGSVTVRGCEAHELRLVLDKLSDMGHSITLDEAHRAITLTACQSPRAVSFRTMPFPGFPTDLQAPMMVVQLMASGSSDIMETVFENRMTHVPELHKMGARIALHNRLEATTSFSLLHGAHVRAVNIRAGAALVLAACAAKGATTITGIDHIIRGYVAMPEKMCLLGAKIHTHI